MTAEIAVLNRSAVALAADSAVTIGQGANTKTYLSENKLFEISETKPIGLMIYNSLDFYGYPWEVLIKDFREAKGNSGCESVSDWTQCFLDWLYSNHLPSEEQQEVQFEHNVKDMLDDPFRQIRNKLIPLLRRRQTDSIRQRMREILPEVLNEETRAVRELRSISRVDKLSAASSDHAKVLDETTLSDWLASKAPLINAVAVDVFNNYPLTEEDKKNLRNYVFEVYSRHYFSRYHTGLVFAGFGDKQQFPSLHNVTIDGVVGDRLRCLEGDYYVVDRSNSGTVVPFAQPDVAHRFLNGIDNELEAEIVRYFANTIENLVTVIGSSLSLGSKRRKILRDTLASAASFLEQQYFESASGELKKAFFRTIEDMVRLMPKQEMANLAESLVNITIIKRKASAGLETVGGPIDVAVISRHEGFVWVKRKHYFDGQLNPRYLWRKFSRGNPNGER
jgi:hypothetical protein